MSYSPVTRDGEHLAARLLEDRQHTGLGVHDGFSTLLANSAGADFLWASSFAASAICGFPDAGLLEASTMAPVVGQISRVTTLPLVVDMDAGYGDELKVLYSADAMTRAGATAICIEDNPISKRSSLYDCERELVSPEEHCARIMAARAGIADRPCAVIARTEALVAGLGVDEALARAAAYVDAGAHAVFAQAVAPDRGDQLMEFCTRWRRRTPVFLAPTAYSHCTRAQWYAAGASHVIFANQGIRAAHGAMLTVFRQLLASDAPIEAEEDISSVADIAEEVGAKMALK